jgi:hypothetical protein
MPNETGAYLVLEPLQRSSQPDSPLTLEKRLRARERNRTADLRITSALLCRLSYSGLTCCFVSKSCESSTSWTYLWTYTR